MKLVLVLVFAGLFAASNETAAQKTVALGRFAEARQQYRQLLAHDPNNTVYLNWVARLSAWLKEYDAALDGYDTVLALAPDNLEAVLGKAYVRMWRKEFDAAELLLAQAKQLNGQSLAWQIAKFSFHVLQRQARPARERLAAIRQLDPHNTSLPTFEKQLESLVPFTAEVGYETQSLRPFLSAVPVWRSTSLNLTWRGERNTLGMRLEQDEVNATQQARVGLSFSHRFGERWWMRGSALLGIGGNAMLKQDVSAGGAVRLSGRWAQRLVLSGDYRHIRFAQTVAQVVSPTIEFNQNNSTRWQISGARNWQRDANSASPKLFLLLRYDRQVTKRLRTNFSWSQVPDFSQWGWSSALTYQLKTRLAVNANYGNWFGLNHTQQNTYGISLSVR